MKEYAFNISDWYFHSIEEEESFEPNLQDIALLQKRRMSQLTKLLFHAIHSLHVQGLKLPILFVSKYGESKRLLDITQQIVASNEVSPTAFSFSVFNSAIAQAGIIFNNQESAVAMSIWENQIEIALIQALAFLSEEKSQEKHQEKLLVIIADEALPSLYFESLGVKIFPYIFGAVLELASPQFILTQNINEPDCTIEDFVDFLNSQQKSISMNKLEIKRK